MPMTPVMLDTQEVIDAEEEVSVFAQRLRASVAERSDVLARERTLLQQQLDDLRIKATAEPRRGWSVRRVISI